MTAAGRTRKFANVRFSDAQKKRLRSQPLASPDHDLRAQDEESGDLRVAPELELGAHDFGPAAED